MHRIYADRINPRGMSRPPTVRQPETQSFLPAIQRTADASSTSRQTTRKLSLSSQLSSAALIAHPSPGKGHSTQHLHPNSRAAPSPAALKNQPVRRVLPVTGLCRRGADSWLAPDEAAGQAASPAQAYVQSPPPLPTKIKICYNTTTQQKIKQQSGIHIPLHQTLMNAITNQSHSKSKERQGKT